MHTSMMVINKKTSNEFKLTEDENYPFDQRNISESPLNAHEMFTEI